MRRLAAGMVLVAVFVAGFALGTGLDLVRAQTDTDTLFAPFWETWDFLHSEYVQPLDDEALMEAALNGMLDSLGDPNTFYMDAEVFDIAQNDLNGEFEGIGATVQQDEDTGALLIVDTLPGSPAEAAGVLGGDAIVEVDGEDITGLPQVAIIGLIRGEAGTEVVLGIRREGEPHLLVIPVTRARIELESVHGEELEGGIVYMQMARFGSTTGQELHDALVEWDVENRPGLILDLRGNPGGFLSTAIEVASEFIGEGVVVIERFREGEQVYEAQGDPTAPTVPLVILVDAGSASASELVTGALQDHGRATVVGTVTYGKGSVQTWRPLSNGGGVRVTVALWYTPDDRTIHEVGLTPDVVVEQDEADPTADPQLDAALSLLLKPAVAGE
ncbi:MAG: S41 family peptidase [Anaerolineae bacterium]|nr:S41 family peptidase [Anaerolineae bacterium]